MTKTSDQKYCHECGAVISIRAEICPACGVRQPHNSHMMAAPSQFQSTFGQNSRKDKNTAAALALLLGGIGMHKFYLGKPLWGVVYIVFCMTLIPSILGLIEGIKFILMSDDEFDKKFCGAAFSENKNQFTDSVNQRGSFPPKAPPPPRNVNL